jgi:hypothetical protein
MLFITQKPSSHPHSKKYGMQGWGLFEFDWSRFGVNWGFEFGGGVYWIESGVEGPLWLILKSIEVFKPNNTTTSGLNYMIFIESAWVFP